MKKFFALLLILFTVFSCTNNSTDEKKMADNRIALRTDTTNLVKLSDTLVIFASTCRGCAYEGSTSFSVSDSMDIIRLADIVTADNSPADMAGGSISKTLVLVPQKAGTTIFKLYKFWTQERTARDSANFSAYKIEVQQ